MGETHEEMMTMPLPLLGLAAGGAAGGGAAAGGAAAGGAAVGGGSLLAGTAGRAGVSRFLTGANVGSMLGGGGGGGGEALKPPPVNHAAQLGSYNSLLSPGQFGGW